jgi:hypothetical protein
LEKGFKMKDLAALVFSAYKKNLAGLPSFCRLAMLDLFEYCGHAAGTISIKSLDKIAREHFRVDLARGCQPEDITGDSICNAFRTIKKFKSDHFKFTTVNQQIVIAMPFLRKLYNAFNGKNAHVAAARFRPIENIKQTKTNKLTETPESIFSKNPIKPDFQPSEATINVALSRGLSQVTSHEEIHSYIQKEQQ